MQLYVGIKITSIKSVGTKLRVIASSRLNMRASVDSFATIVLLLVATTFVPVCAAAEIQRSLKAEVQFRLAHPCPSTGQTYGTCVGYVIDRVVPLVCGGAEDPSNMQWQTIAEAKAKDKWERVGCRPGRKLVMPGPPAFTEAYPLQEPETPMEAQPLAQ
jgi:hypothetical protein